MDIQIKQRLFSYLSSFATSAKNEKIAKVINNRTRHITVALEDIYQPHNISAALRSCEIFGVQDTHLIQERCSTPLMNSVSKGASQWLTISRYPKTAACFAALKNKRYRIVATTPHAQARTLDELPIDTPLALVFGTEDTGLSENALALADEFVTIPMFGFTQSFNISVSVALCLQHITGKMRHSSFDWHLSPQEQLDVQIEWLISLLPAGKQLAHEFMKKTATGT